MKRTTFEALKRQSLAVLIVAGFIGWFVGGNWLEDRAERRADHAFGARVRAAVLAKLPDPRTARIISLQAESGAGYACGWVDLGSGQGSVPFNAMTEVDRPAERPLLVVLPKPTQTNVEEWADAAFTRQLILRLCSGGRLPSTPRNAVSAPQVDRPLAALWGQGGPEWAVIPAPESAGYLAVSRRIGGGAIISPVMETPALANAWTHKEGSALATLQNARGRARLNAFDACLARHPPGDRAREDC